MYWHWLRITTTLGYLFTLRLGTSFPGQFHLVENKVPILRHESVGCGVWVPFRSRHFLSQNLWHFQKNIRSCVKNKCCCPGTVNIWNVNFIPKISKPPEPVLKKTWNSECLALIAQMVRAFGMNPKVGGSSPPQVETISVTKTLTLWQEHPFVCRKWMRMRLVLTITYRVCFVFVPCVEPTEPYFSLCFTTLGGLPKWV